MVVLRLASLLAFSCLVISTVSAEVQTASENGFVIVHQSEVNASRDDLYQAAIQIEKWWDPAHSYSGDASNFSLDVRPGGMFLEKLPMGGFVEHMRITVVMPGRLVRLSGGLGPLATDGLTGAMTWNFADAEESGKSKLTWRYSVGGFRPDGLESLAQAVDGVLAIQFERLLNLAERSDQPQPVEPSPKANDSDLKIEAATNHTFTRAAGFVAPDAEIDQFAFIAGRWTGEAMGGWCEEVWSVPAGGEMQGMFQFVKDDQVEFRELFSLQSNQDGDWQIRLKHFDRTLKGWEEKQDAIVFDLLEILPIRLVFDGLTMELVESDKLMVYVRTNGSEGQVGELTFEYTKD